ncbi:hypothetical protein T492DRAFT_859974 [Pavlovales sp. CCMP2436]|nr:hypothetical protein T492DRAFT_859974 [Pavlovales sp. CCMP2436]
MDSDEEFPDVDVDALLASTGVTALVAQHAGGEDLEAMLRQAAGQAAAGDDADVGAAQLTADDLTDHGLLADLSALGFEDDEAGVPPAQPARPRQPSQPSKTLRAAGMPALEADLEADVLAMSDDEGEPPGSPTSGGDQASAASPAPRASAGVGVEEVDGRIGECLREALACKQRGDQKGAIAWLACKKGLTAQRPEAEAGLLQRRRLLPRPAATPIAPSTVELV